jgi:hypothetical protein
MLDDYRVTKPLSVFGDVLFDPGPSRLREGIEQKQGTMILTTEIRSVFRGRTTTRAKCIKHRDLLLDTQIDRRNPEPFEMVLIWIVQRVLLSEHPFSALRRPW